MIIIALYFIAMAFAAVAVWLSMYYKTPSLNGWMAFSVLFMFVLIHVIDKFQRRIVSMNKKSLIIVAFVLLCAFPPLAVAAVQVTFTDGNTTVWESYVVRGDKYCTRLVFGEICYLRADIKSFAKAPAENAGGDYGTSVMGSDNAGNKDLEVVLSKSEADDRAFKAKRDAEIDARARAEQKRVKNNRYHGKADWAQ